MSIFWRAAIVSLGLAVTLGVAADATPLSSDRDMVTGVSVTEADCKAHSGRLWVKVETRGFCVRFWSSTAGGNKDEALVAFDGDIGMRGGKLHETARSVSDESLQRAANNGSRFYRGPYIWIARPGAFGSSGHQIKDRRTLLEIRIAMAALDALKRYNGFTRFHLVGQSGGGHTVAALAQLRSDVGCAVITSGTISVRSMQRDAGRPIVGKPQIYDPIDHVNAMKQRPDLRLFVVSDRNDKIVSYRSQLEFVERAKAHNLPITHVTATATDKDSHGLFAYGHRVAVDCANKARDQILVSKAQAPLPVVRSQPDAPPAGTGPSKAALAWPSSPFASRASVRARVALYEEAPSDRQGKRFVGSAIWRTEMVSAGPDSPPNAEVRADIEIPGRRTTVTLFIRRDLNQVQQVASHTIEILFSLPAGFPFGGIANVPGVLMKQAEQTRGSSLGGTADKVASNYFFIGLSAVKPDMQRNIQLLKERGWLDIPIVYNNGRRAILSIEKGTPGERALEEAFKLWEQTSASAAPHVTAPQPSSQAVAPVITPPPLVSSTNEPKKVTTTTVREDNSGADPATKARAPAVAPLAPRPDSLPTPTLPAQTARDTYVVHVSAQKTEDEARESYQALQQKYPSVFGGREADIRRADLRDKGAFYWAQIGPFQTVDEANAFCGDLKAAGGQCIVQKNASGASTEQAKEIPRAETPSPRAKPKEARPRRAMVERPRSEPTRGPRHAKARDSRRRCFVLRGNSFCE